MPIIGTGDIASVLVDHPGRLYFASGVSNSGELREAAYRREEKLLLSQLHSKRLVYFSSLSVFYSNGRYAKHKRHMEEMVRSRFPHHAIVRIGNIDWGSNPNTLINHLRIERARGKKLDIQDVFRYVTDEDEFLYWVSMIPEWNCEMNIPGRRMSVAQIVTEYVD